MLTLLIVDDEAVIRRGIHHYIDWKSHGIKVIGEAKDGSDGLEQALKLHPDIIITDIKMPKMTGIEMAEKIREINLKTAIIFLSGYDEREYLISAIRNGINDFILKSADSHNILEAVLRCKERIEKQQAEKPAIDCLPGNSMETIKNSFLLSIISGTISGEEILSQAKLFDFYVAGPYYMAFYIPFPLPDDTNQLILSLLYHFSKLMPCMTIDEKYGLVGFFNMEACPDSPAALLSEYEEFWSCRPDIKMIISQPFSVLSESSPIFKGLIRLGKSVCWFDTSIIIHDGEIKPDIPEDLIYLLESEIICAYQNKNIADFLGKLEQYYSFSRQVLLPLEQYQESFRRIIISVCAHNSAYGPAHSICGYINTCQNPLEIYQYVNRIFEKEAAKIPHNAIVQAAKKYIEENYNKAIGLKEISNYCHASPSYISKIFKEDISLGIVEYMHSIRIEKAKEILKSSDMRITDIASHVGYPDYKRFSFYFLKYAGQSPREYRQKGRT